MLYSLLLTRSPSLENLQPVTSRLKQPELVESLIKLARELGPETRLPRVKELSKALGVSLVTLDQGLRQLEQRGLIERHAGSGIYVTYCILQKTIGLVFGLSSFASSGSTFYSILLSRCIERAASHQERFSFFLDLPNLNRVSLNSSVHHDLVAALSDHKLDGLLVASVTGPDQEQWLRDQGVPTVCLNSGGNPGSVTIDNKGLVRMAAQALMEEGCQNIGLIAMSPNEIDLFRSAASELGFHFQDSWIQHPEVLPRKTSVARGVSAAKNLLEQNKASNLPLPAGLIITNDLLASGACRHFTSKHLVIGQDIKIASHSNKDSPVLSEWNNVLIRCEIDPAEVADTLISMLETLMEGRTLTKEVVFIAPHLKFGNRQT